MNLFLVNTNKVIPPITPVGILYLAGFLRENGFTPHIIDLATIADEAALKARLAELPVPDLIGFSIRNIDSTQMNLREYFLPDIYELITKIRSRYPGAPTILGGPGFSIEPLEIIEQVDADFGIVAEGETPFLELLQCLAADRDYRGIPGLIYRGSSGHVLNPPRQQDHAFLSSLPFQATDLIDYPRYLEMGGMASIQTKRGCALDCNYCTYPIIEGRRFRLVDPERIADELEAMIAEGLDYFHFTDSVFNIPRSHAINVCKAMIKRQISMEWHAYTSPLGFDDELAAIAQEAGADGILFGADSCSDKMLGEFGKNFTRQDIFRAAAACRKRDLEYSLHILFGAPGETIQTVRETLDALDEMNPTAAFIASGLRVYRGTPLHRKLVKQGKIPSEQSMLEPFFYLSEELPSDICEVVRSYALARDFAFADVTLGSSPSINPELGKLRKKLRGPSWRLLKELRKAESNSAGSSMKSC